MNNWNAIVSSPITIGIALAMAGLIGVGVLALIAHKLGMQKHLKSTQKWIFSFNGVFWMANIACMAYSAQNAGYIFGLYEWSGYAVGIIIDLLIIVFTQVMMMAKARGERERAGKILLFIVFCCALSLVGNVAHNLHMAGSIKQDNGLDGVWFDTCIPYIAAVMPLFLIALAWVKDLKVDPLEFEDPVRYAEAEKKRLQYMQTQVSSRQQRAALDAQLISIEKVEKQNKQLRNGKLPKSFRWPWEQPLAVDALLAQLTTQIQPGYEIKITELESVIETLKVDIHRQQEATVLPVSSLQSPAQNLSTASSTGDAVAVDKDRQPVDDLFVDSLLDGEDDTFDDIAVDERGDMYASTENAHVVDTGERETVNWQATKPRPRVTVKLPELHGTPAKKERITDNLAATTKKTSTRKVSAVNAKERIRRLLKKQPDMEPAEIAAKVGVTRQHAHKVKAQIIAEMSA